MNSPIAPELSALLNLLLAELRSRLDDQMVGLYLHGSLAYGGFDPNTSDIDFLVVTQATLSEATFSSLQAMHARLFSSALPWARKLEGAYIPLAQLRRHDPAHLPVPWLGVNGHFAWEKLGSDWIIQRWVLREKGLVLSGPPLQPLIAPVTADDLRLAVRTSLVEWWSPPFPSPERFQSDGYLAYTVLTMCRSLYVMEHGCIASKSEASRWAMEKFQDPWNSLIALASEWVPGISFQHREEVFSLVRLTLEIWGLPADS